MMEEAIMRETIKRAGRTLALVGLCACPLACGGDDAGPDCSFEACGGDPVGEWDVTFCLDDEPIFPDNCPTANIERSVEIGGTITLRQDMTYDLMLQTTLSVDATIPQSCQEEGRACEEDEECVTEGDHCRCQFTIEDADEGGGTWSSSGTSLTFENEFDTFYAEYCVDGDLMKITYAVSGPPVPFAGRLVLQRQ
jgi:hypothetical protein